MNIRYLSAGLCLALILLSGACDNPSGGDDDGAATTTTAAQAAQDAADSFYDTHRGALALPMDMLTLGDTDPVNAALEAYTSLRANVRILLAGEKAHLDLLKSKLDEMGNAAESGVYYTLTDLLAWLIAQPDNTADTPCAVAYYGDETINAVYRVLAAAGKYTALDLSKSGVYGFSAGTEAGRELIVSLRLPDTLTATPGGSSSVFMGYISLKTVSAAGLITLGQNTFRGLAELISADLPKVNSVGATAFMACTGLTTVNLPEAVTIGLSAFRDCTGLTTLASGFSSILPKAVTIGDYAFQGCTGLTNVTLPEAVTIGSFAFRNCTGITSISADYQRVPNLPKAVTIGDNVFYDCTSLATVTLPEAITISATAFNGCPSLATVTLPKAASIGNNAFQNCASLTTVTLGLAPPVIGTNTAIEITIFSGAATAAKTITIRAPQLTLYREVAPWKDKLGANKDVSYFWDNNAATRDNLTVVLEAL
jgi:hypothetical protein